MTNQQNNENRNKHFITGINSGNAFMCNSRRVSYPTDAVKFWKLVALGKELREIHLMESPKVEEYITGYPEDGDNIVGKPTYKKGSVYINRRLLWL